MSIREAKLCDATAMARVSVESYRAAYRDQIPEASLMQFTYEESERNWARTLRDLESSAEHTKYIYVAEDDELRSLWQVDTPAAQARTTRLPPQPRS